MQVKSVNHTTLDGYSPKNKCERKCSHHRHRTEEINFVKNTKYEKRIAIIISHVYGELNTK